MRSRLRLLLPAACFLVGQVARAEEPSAPFAPDAEARAKELFDAALAAAQKGNYRDACPKFRASYAINRKASTLFNLGVCYERNGQTASAWGTFSEAVGAARQAGHPDWSMQAAERVRALEPRLVKVTVVVPPEARVAGLTLTRDGATLTPSEWGLPTPVDPGDHVLSATAPGKTTWETTFTSTEGAPLVVRVPPLASEPVVVAKPEVVAPPPPPPPPAFWSPLRVAGLSTGGAGVVALGVGGVLALVAKGRYDASRRACPSTACQDAGALSDNRAAFDLATGATATLIGGAVFTAAGASLFLLASDRKPSAGGIRATPTLQVRGHDAAMTLSLGGAF
jgi:hypothetical protein